MWFVLFTLVALVKSSLHLESTDSLLYIANLHLPPQEVEGIQCTITERILTISEFATVVVDR